MIPRYDLKAKIKADFGPRHFAFHPDGTRTYLLNEMSSTLIEFSYHKGKLSPTISVSCKAEDCSAELTSYSPGLPSKDPRR